jgi:hypothetical protein
MTLPSLLRIELRVLKVVRKRADFPRHPTKRWRKGGAVIDAFSPITLDFPDEAGCQPWCA